MNGAVLDGRRVSCRTWLERMFPEYCKHEFGNHHIDFWRHIDGITLDNHPKAWVSIWPRGGAKSTSTELATVFLGATRRRRYGLYVCGTQEKADDHVSTIGMLLESKSISTFYPRLGERKLGKHGNSRGWRRNRVWTADGFVIDALGLDTAVRGVKLEEQRPDFIIIDDVDREHDTEELTKKRIETISTALLPAGTMNVAIIAVQNLITKDSFFAQLADGRADLLYDRIVSGPFPAIHNPEWGTDEDGAPLLVGGEPLWEGQDLEACNRLMRLIGPKSFRKECQHEVAKVEGTLWSDDDINQTRLPRSVLDDVEFARLTIGVDPAATDKKTSDEVGIIVAGTTHNCPCGRPGTHLLITDDRSLKGTPGKWGATVVGAYFDWDANDVCAEVNMGGDMVSFVIKTANRSVPVKDVRATRGKVTRAEPVSMHWQRPLQDAHIVGSMPELEKQMTTYRPGTKSPDRMDAMVWAAYHLGFGKKQPKIHFNEETEDDEEHDVA